MCPMSVVLSKSNLMFEPLITIERELMYGHFQCLISVVFTKAILIQTLYRYQDPFYKLFLQGGLRV